MTDTTTPDRTINPDSEQDGQQNGSDPAELPGTGIDSADPAVGGSGAGGVDGSDDGRTDSTDGIVGDDELRSSAIWRRLAWGALGVCSLLALFALAQFYGSVTEAIVLWVEPKHQPLMHAAFNLVVLLCSLVGVSLLVRELR